jgi:hypothetical protein
MLALAMHFQKRCTHAVRLFDDRNKLAAARSIVSSVGLQKCLYFNGMYSTAWLLTTICILMGKVRCMMTVMRTSRTLLHHRSSSVAQLRHC